MVHPKLTDAIERAAAAAPAALAVRDAAGRADLRYALGERLDCETGKAA
jgi:hypothetical protein